MAERALPRELVVLLQGRVAGVVRRSDAAGAHVLTYKAAWRDDAAAFPLPRR